MTRRVLPFGDRALLLELDSLDEVLALYPALNDSRPPGVVDLVPAARSILARIDPRTLPLRQAEAWLAATHLVDSTARHTGPAVVIDVDYSGPDLEEVARHLGRTPDEVVTLHTGAVWTVAFSGFAPGFGYLVRDDRRLVVPRRSSPRTEVPAGSVGLAGEFSGIYPRASPGGWQLIGRTDAPLWDARLWDATGASPALLTPGRTVQFRAVRS